MSLNRLNTEKIQAIYSSGFLQFPKKADFPKGKKVVHTLNSYPAVKVAHPFATIPHYVFIIVLISINWKSINQSVVAQ